MRAQKQESGLNLIPKKSTNPIYSGYIYEDTTIVVANLIARCITKWNEEEIIMFYTAVSQLSDSKNQDGLYESRLNKASLRKLLKVNPKNTAWIRIVADNMAAKSFARFTGEGSEAWLDGYLITNVESKPRARYITIYFNPFYIPLLKRVKKFYTKFKLDDLLALRGDKGGEAAIRLFVYLMSWTNFKNSGIQKRAIMRDDVAGVFGLEEKEYWRDCGTENERFDWYSFEKRVLKPAVERINAVASRGECAIRIEDYQKQKLGPYVKEFDFSYILVTDATQRVDADTYEEIQELIRKKSQPEEALGEYDEEWDEDDLPF